MTTAEEDDSDNLLLWILVWSELVVFGALIAAFLIAFTLDHHGFSAARAHLRPQIAGFNTIVLLASGWQAAIAVSRDVKPGRQRLALFVAAVLGFVFTALKIFEYSTEVGHASNPAYGVFFELYFMLTGFHLVHVIFVSLILLVVAWKPRPANVTLVTTLWHIIDLVWIVIFPIVYMV